MFCYLARSEASFDVVAVIELDGASHDGVQQAKRDRKKDDATAAAGIEMVRYRNSALPEISVLVARFASPAMSAAPATRP